MIQETIIAINGTMMKKISMPLILWGAFSWSNAMAQTNEPEHKHEQHEDVKEGLAK